MNAIFNRKSVRQFLDKPVEAEKLEKLLRAAMQAPSAKNQQPWEFVVVEDKDLRAQLATVTPYTAPAGRAPVVIAVCGNLERITTPKFWEVDCAAAIENILLEAVELDLGGVWMGIFGESAHTLADLLHLPDNVVPMSMVAIGYPENDLPAVDRFDQAKIHHERW